MNKDDTQGNKGRSARDERLKAALRENLKRRKAQARGRNGMTIVTPDDDKRENDSTRDER
ncbi:MAG: hypothetical protein HY242_15195 [Afipia sp.]|nr:hypothetical protein [Afipia sp.]